MVSRRGHGPGPAGADLFAAGRRPRSSAPSWKPEGCADCGEVYPSYSLNGAHGPWRCRDCHYAVNSIAGGEALLDAAGVRARAAHPLHSNEVNP